MSNVGLFVVLITAGTIWCIWGVRCGRWSVRCFRRRPDHRGLWMAAFRAENRPRVDALLVAICDAFFVPPRYRFRLRPSDDIHAFYRLNMRGSLADSLEYTFLAIDLERDFDISPAIVDGVLSARTCTIAALVRLIAQPQRKLTAMRGA
jgi:hypothetical protein